MWLEIDTMDSAELKVAQVCLEYAPSFGGSAKTVQDFAKVFKSKVIAFTTVSNGMLAREWNEDVFRVPIRPGFLGKNYAWPDSLEDLRAAEMILRSSNLAIIHLLYRYHTQWASSIARKAQIPYWVIPHGILDPYVFTRRALQKRIWLRIWGYSVMRNAQAIIFATEREREKALPYIKGCKTSVVHWPVEYVDTSERTEARLRVRTLHHIPNEARLLLWLGRLHPIKKPLHTIEVFRQAAASSLHLMLVGPDDAMTRQDCERFCIERDIKNVHFIGPIYGREKYQYYMAADGYVSLSFKENFNYTAAEALASGLPVILSPGNDLSSELRYKNCGWMLQTDNIQETISAFRQFASMSQAAISNMGLAGQHWARTELSLEQFGKIVRMLAATF